MRISPFLIGLRSESDQQSKIEAAAAAAAAAAAVAEASENELVAEGGERFKFELARAKDINLIDDGVLGQLFSPLGYAFVFFCICFSF